MIGASRPISVERYYREIIAPRSPALWLPLTDESGTAAVDLTGNTAWSYTGSPTLAAEPSPMNRASVKAPTLNGSTQYVAGPNSSATAVGLNFTLQLWVKPVATSSGRILCRRVLGGLAYDCYINGDGSVSIYLQNPTGGLSVTTGTNIVTYGAWNEITYTRAGASLKILCNGLNTFGGQGVFNTDATSINPNVVTAIGIDTFGAGSSQAGAYDMCGFYNTTLPDDEILKGYLAAANGLRQ